MYHAIVYYTYILTSSMRMSVSTAPRAALPPLALRLAGLPPAPDCPATGAGEPPGDPPGESPSIVDSPGGSASSGDPSRSSPSPCNCASR